MEAFVKKLFKFVKKMKAMLDEDKSNADNQNSQSSQLNQEEPAKIQQPANKQTQQPPSYASVVGPTSGGQPGKTPKVQQIPSNSSNATAIPSSEELKNPERALERLWELDINRFLVPINTQGKTTIMNHGDKATLPLFENIDSSKFTSTFKIFIALLDNYTAKTGVAENHSQIERKEAEDFILAVLDTAIGNYLGQYLTSFNINNHAKYLNDLWFGFTKRDAHQDSSPFEHVFVGEIRNDKIIGMHNWIQAYLEERNGNFDYQGYLPCRYKSSFLGNIQFIWHGYLKQVSTLFIGTTPEFELALYTIAYLHICRDNLESIVATFDSVPVKITVHTFGKGKIGGAYPEIVRT